MKCYNAVEMSTKFLSGQFSEIVKWLEMCFLLESINSSTNNELFCFLFSRCSGFPRREADEAQKGKCLTWYCPWLMLCLLSEIIWIGAQVRFVERIATVSPHLQDIHGARRTKRLKWALTMLVMVDSSLQTKVSMILTLIDEMMKCYRNVF